MIASILVCIGLSLFCFVNGMLLAGILSLLGILPGAGIFALTVASIILALEGFYLAAVFPPLVIAYNIWLGLVAKR